VAAQFNKGLILSEQAAAADDESKDLQFVSTETVSAFLGACAISLAAYLNQRR